MLSYLVLATKQLEINPLIF